MLHKEPTYILIPVHNRKLITLSCLERLHQNNDLGRYHVVVVDDGSTDGTAESIQAFYPDVVVLHGDGNLWWTGAIRKGMEYAYEQGAEFLIWLNDDTLPSLGCIPAILSECTQHPNKIVSAQCYASSDFKTPTYGGQKKGLLSIKLFPTPPDQTIACDCMSGNLVCLPRSVVNKIGYPPSRQLPHCLADIVYTWEAKKAGYELEVLGDATAVCDFNPMDEGWASSSIPMEKRWRLLSSPKSNLYPSAYWNFCKSFYGNLALITFMRVYFRLTLFTVIRWILPLRWLRTMKGLKKKLLS
ncbi:glycosyltransferase family 2 protein [Leptolyngbya sp. FACHB-321]|uniref:glycosyltransferase family 2 protein n=1 Tax=Leptolyngbya sp. FACHB-321 TaxID=2692807 RepID=UPI00168322FF|nr:glycosyltransferase family 2 protein [Leptolyngbya sp. FACHB-321]MBD2037928.1 glycosyltransferase family 2 protein [Leptolyngbya sp. FACHB-321]